MTHIVNSLLVGLAAAILILAGYGLMAIADGQPVHAKSGDVPDCVAIGKAGASVVSRCEDTELDKVCYVTTGGFMFCLDE